MMVLDVARSLLGIVTVILLSWLLSRDKKNISWSLVAKVLLLQCMLALVIVKVGFVQLFFEWLSKGFVVVLQFSKEGSRFVFGSLVDTEQVGYIFAFQVLPAVLFFAAVTSLLFYYGIIQAVVSLIAKVFNRIAGLSGAESLAVAANIFIGQLEAPLLIKAYLNKMSLSGLFLVMAAGMATVSGAILAAYAQFLGGDDPAMQIYFTRHLIIASVLAAPGVVVVAKIIMPAQTSTLEKQSIDRTEFGSNPIDAIVQGTLQGLTIVLNIAALLLVFIAFIALVNYLLQLLGSAVGLHDWIHSFSGGLFSSLSLQFMLGYLLAPLMWLMGIPWHDAAMVGSLLGEKIVLNEFVSYIHLAQYMEESLIQSRKSIIMTTYMLCGFANFGSVGMLIAGMGVMAPTRRKELARIGFRAMLAGLLASLLSATIIGALL